MKRFALIILTFFLANGPVAAQGIIDDYIDSALQNNLVLQRKNISLEQARYGLKIAKAMFYPSVDFKVDYLTASGGRDIQLPIGDLLNGVYATLNQLTQTNNFPQVKNEKIGFLPQDFYDARIRISAPLVNAQLKYNKEIQEQKIQLSSLETEVYKRELVRDVKTAYYNFKQALEAVEIFKSVKALADEGKRVNERLLSNGKGLPAYVLRSESEVESVTAELADAAQQVDQARRYFNFLLNRDQEARISATQPDEKVVSDIEQKMTADPEPAGREEIKMLETSRSLQRTAYQLARSALYPGLSGFIDLGSQYEHWQFNKQSRYFMFGLSLNVPIFSGNQNRYKMSQADLAIQDATLQLQYTRAQLDMSSHIAQNKLRAAYQKYLSAKKQLASAETYQRLVERGFREGTNSYIETIDARTQLSKAQTALSISRYKMLAAEADLERETASYQFNSK